MQKLTPEEAAEIAYSGDYGGIYDELVSQLRTKKEQYADIAEIIINSLSSGNINVLEFGPSKTPNLANALQTERATLPASQSEDSINLFGLEYFDQMLNRDPNFPVKMIQADIRDTLPLANSSMDFVVINSVLLSLNSENLSNVILEVARILKPGGSLVLSELDERIGGAISTKVLMNEIKLLWKEYPKSPRGQLNYLKDLFYQLKKSSKLKQVSDSANAEITESHKGFSLDFMTELLQNAGLQVEQIRRTYADTYHLISATKPNL